MILKMLFQLGNFIIGCGMLYLAFILFGRLIKKVHPSAHGEDFRVFWSQIGMILCYPLMGAGALVAGISAIRFIWLLIVAIFGIMF